jgi:hypothetical protein
MRGSNNNGPCNVRFKISVEGLTYNRPEGIHEGDVVEVPTRDEALRLYRAGYAQPEHETELGDPYVPYIV